MTFNLYTLFINGIGGTGKLFLIETIKCFVDSLWKAKPGEISCAVVASTGLAAFNVGGLTNTQSVPIANR